MSLLLLHEAVFLSVKEPVHNINTTWNIPTLIQSSVDFVSPYLAPEINKTQHTGNLLLLILTFSHLPATGLSRNNYLKAFPQFFPEPIAGHLIMDNG